MQAAPQQCGAHAGVRAMQGGPAAWCLTSRSPAAAGHYIWYYLTLNVTEAPPIATIDVSAAVRKAVAVQLDIGNPLNEPASFSVAYGSNMLVGPRHVALAPLQTMQFELFFAPLLPGDSQAELVFSSIKVCRA